MEKSIVLNSFNTDHVRSAKEGNVVSLGCLLTAGRRPHPSGGKDQMGRPSWEWLGKDFPPPVGTLSSSQD